MTEVKKKAWIVFGIILLVLIIDQWLKIYVKTSYSYNTGFDLLGWSKAKIHFVENEGMAFGIKFWGNNGKLLLSSFRLIMIGVLIYILRNLIKQNEKTGLLVSFGLILAGAIGNMIDSAFYGLIFSESLHHHYGQIAEMFPKDAPTYGENLPMGGFLYGRVVDMLYFPLIDTNLPEWFPFVGGDRFQFFKPIFNIADTAISTGVISILLFHRKFFRNESETPKETDQELKSITADQEE